MGATRSSLPDKGEALREAVRASLAHALPRGGRFAVALSGGRDSIALLHATLAVARDADWEVVAFHVDHGLSPNASAWAQFVCDRCDLCGVRCFVQPVRVERRPRESLEASARVARYGALNALARAHDVDAVMLAHQADDQAETTLLQLLRGAGPRGLAAMPLARFDGRIWWLRPFLTLPRATIETYVATFELAYIDDESNDDTQLRRNALRKAIVPLLGNVAPGYPHTLVRAAELQAEAALLADDLARIDAADAFDGTTLDRSALARLSQARARNLLRWFLHRHGVGAPSRSRLCDMLSQLVEAKVDARIDLAHAGARLGVHRDRIILHRASTDTFVTLWDGGKAVELPHGTLHLAATTGQGLATRYLTRGRVTIESGRRGERLALPGRASHRPVADLLREAGVPHWERRSLPRIYVDDALAAVAPLGVDAAFAATAREPAVTPAWQPRVQTATSP